jgi:hypothetical protein
MKNFLVRRLLALFETKTVRQYAANDNFHFKFFASWQARNLRKELILFGHRSLDKTAILAFKFYQRLKNPGRYLVENEGKLVKQ